MSWGIIAARGKFSKTRSKTGISGTFSAIVPVGFLRYLVVKAMGIAS